MIISIPVQTNEFQNLLRFVVLLVPSLNKQQMSLLNSSAPPDPLDKNYIQNQMYLHCEA